MRKWINPAGTPTYFSWRNMRARCYNPNDIGYSNYGGRGITVCDRWREDYDAFVEDMGLCPDGLTIERNDTYGNYEPSNCRWATYTEQMNNRRELNTFVDYDDRTQTVAQWAREIEVSSEVLLDRLKRMPLDRAMTKGLLTNRAPGKHGTIGTYVGKRCRCTLCVENMREYKRRAYANKTSRVLEYDL